MSIYGDSIFLNEGLFNRKKENNNQEEKINFKKRTKNFLDNPKTIKDKDGILYGVVFGLLLSDYNYNDSKFLSLIKNNVENFTKEETDNFGYFSEYWLTEYQSEEIIKYFGKINSIYAIAYGADETIWYCKEKNKLFRTDYKRVYFEFSLNRYKEWPAEYMNNKEE